MRFCLRRRVDGCTCTPTLVRATVDAGKRWRVTLTHLEWVKSYAPRIWHVVADVHCVEE